MENEVTHKKTHWAIAFFALLGVILSVYMTYAHYTTAAALCKAGDGTVSCDLVNKSEYSEIFGIPVAIIGILGYLLLLWINLPYTRSKTTLFKKEKLDVHTLTFALIGIIFTVYFNYLQLFIIGTICFLCEISAGLITLITITALINYKHCNHKLTLGTKILLILVLLFVAWLAYEVTPKPLDDFAKCLSEKEAIFYGAFWCPHCAAQKMDFSSSMKYINYIECSTSDKRQTDFCNNEGIESYPTWKFKDGTVKTGHLRLEELAKLTGCELKK